MATDTAAERRPLRVFGGGQARDGALWDGHRTLNPGDEGYDEALRQAERFSNLYGIPIPFVEDEDNGEQPKEQQP